MLGMLTIVLIIASSETINNKTINLINECLIFAVLLVSCKQTYLLARVTPEFHALSESG